MNKYNEIRSKLFVEPRVWLVTGVAGFIGSHLLQELLTLNQSVVGIDNFSTGSQINLDIVRSLVTSSQWSNFRFIDGDIRDLGDCNKACNNVDYILHQAALGSVPRSINDPITTNSVNIGGFLNMLNAARQLRVKSFVYAASSSTYGDHPGLPKKEEFIGKPQSPYAVTKLVDEIYAELFERLYDFSSIGLRYFNVFGPRQNPNGEYAAVIPKWTSAMIENIPLWINGDGETTRDFCFVSNVVQANILAAIIGRPQHESLVYNIAVGDSISLNDLFNYIKSSLIKHYPHLREYSPNYRNFRKGDVRHSLADISLAKQVLGYAPTHSVFDGLAVSIDWYVKSKQFAIGS